MIGLLAVLATASADTAEAEACTRTKIWEQYRDGWHARTLSVEELADGGHFALPVAMYGKSTYRILACADGGAHDLDVLVMDREGKVLARDDTTNREPTVEFTAPATGTYTVVMYHRSASKKGQTAGAAMAVLFK